MNTRVGQEQQNDGSGGRSSMNSALSCMVQSLPQCLKKTNGWMNVIMRECKQVKK